MHACLSAQGEKGLAPVSHHEAPAAAATSSKSFQKAATDAGTPHRTCIGLASALWLRGNYARARDGV